MEKIWKLKRMQTVAPHEHEHKPTRAEFGLAVIIALALTASLFSQQYLKIPGYFTPILIALFIGFKVFHVIKKGGTLLEDYTAIAVMTIFLIVYLILGGNIGPMLIAVFIVILFYSAGLMLWVKTTFGSNHMGHFIVSYIVTVLLVIFLFGGAYLSRSDSFIQLGQPTNLTFEDAIYFSAMTITTVGYGDITPLGINRLLAIIEAFIGMTINVALLGYVLSSNRFRHGD